jgi:hypothetical protein
MMDSARSHHKVAESLTSQLTLQSSGGRANLVQQQG